VRDPTQRLRRLPRAGARGSRRALAT
jgi:hypothetical protein